MRAQFYSYKVNVLRANQPTVESFPVEDLSGSLAYVTSIANTAHLDDISLYVDQKGISRMVARSDQDFNSGSLSVLCRRVEEATRMKTCFPICNNGKVKVDFMQPDILTNGKTLTSDDIPAKSRGLVDFFRANYMPVLLLILDSQGQTTKISSSFPSLEFFSSPLQVDALFRAESKITSTIEARAGYRVREVYAKSENPGVPFPTLNFVVDKV